MRPITHRLERRIRIGQRSVIHERAQHLVMAAIGLVRARQDGIDETQPAGRADALVCDSVTRSHDIQRSRGPTPARLARGFALARAAGATVARSRVLERSHDGRADGDDSSPLSFHVVNG